MIKDNLCLLTDSYKLTHWKQYPPNTQVVYSYFESRGGKYDKTVMFGLQYILKRYLEGSVVSLTDVEDLLAIGNTHFRQMGLVNIEDWMHVVDDHKGYLPVSIKSTAEGMIIPTRNILMSIENTCDRCYWLTNYLETLLVQTWYPITVATLSYNIKKIINMYLAMAKEDINNSDYMLHDFGFRGTSTVESAALGGASHLINFLGTDTLPAIKLIRDYYHNIMAGYSVPASEHSTMTAWGKESEVNAYENMLNKYPTGIVSIVSDSFDIFNACKKIFGETLKDKILTRDGVVVVRPDSGDPLEVVLKVLKILGDKFGVERTENAYKILNPKIKVIQGDGLSDVGILDLLERMDKNGWSPKNIIFGMGGGLLQKVDRDTCQFAFKCSAIKRNNQWQDVWKEPITSVSKHSKRGRLKLIMKDNKLQTVREEELGEDLLVEVFRDGKIFVDYTFDEIRSRKNLWDKFYDENKFYDNNTKVVAQC